MHNVFNEQNITQYYPNFGTTKTAQGPNPQYKRPVGIEAPRYMEFSAKYDW